MNYAIVDKDTLEILNVYFSVNDPDSLQITDTQVRIPVPNNLDIFCIKALDLNTVVEDPEKIPFFANKLANQWLYIKDLRNAKLTECDWTCSILDPPENILSQRNEWFAYRQALRDVTKQTDPFNILWPTPPS